MTCEHGIINKDNCLTCLQREVQILRGQVHECLDCGVYCKACNCVEKKVDELERQIKDLKEELERLGVMTSSSSSSNNE